MFFWFVGCFKMRGGFGLFFIFLVMFIVVIRFFGLFFYLIFVIEMKDLCCFIKVLDLGNRRWWIEWGLFIVNIEKDRGI